MRVRGGHLIRKVVIRRNEVPLIPMVVIPVSVGIAVTRRDRVPLGPGYTFTGGRFLVLLLAQLSYSDPGGIHQRRSLHGRLSGLTGRLQRGLPELVIAVGGTSVEPDRVVGPIDPGIMVSQPIYPNDHIVVADVCNSGC